MEPPGQPLTPRALFLLFLRIALQSFGGTLPFTRRELVERRRILTGPEFAEMLALGQILPGPNVINLSAALGDRHAGPRGAAAAVAGMVVAWRMAEPLRRSPRGILVLAAVFVAVAGIRLPLALVLLVAIPLSLLAHGVFGRLRR